MVVVDVVVVGTPIEVEKKLVSIEMKKMKENLLKAQTKSNASFGPNSSSPPSISLPIAYIEPIYLVRN